MKFITLTKGYKAIVDDEDKSMERCFERLNIFTHFDFLEKVAVYCEQQETTEFTWDEETEKELLAL